MMTTKKSTAVLLALLLCLAFFALPSCEALEQQNADREKLTQLKETKEALYLKRDTLQTKIAALKEALKAPIVLEPTNGYKAGLGEIGLFACNFAPRGYIACRGQAMPTNSAQRLYEKIGDQYGQAPYPNTFLLPDYRPAEKWINKDRNVGMVYTIYNGQ